MLNGAQGLSDALAQALSQGVAGLQMARTILSGATSTAPATPTTNGIEPPAKVA